MDHIPKAYNVLYFGVFFISICKVISKVNSTLEIGCTVSSKYLYSSMQYRIGLDSHLLICFLHMDSSSLCNSTSNIMHLNGYSIRAHSIFQSEGSGCSLKKKEKRKRLKCDFKMKNTFLVIAKYF